MCLLVVHYSSSALFPSLFYGTNATGPQSAAQLELDAGHAIVVYGAEHETASQGWRGVGAALSAQCAALKATAKDAGGIALPRCFVYRQGAFTMPWYDADREAMLSASATSFFLPDSAGVPIVVPTSITDPLWPPPAASVTAAAAKPGQALLWDHRLEAVTAHFVAEAQALAADPSVDGVLYDDVDFVACRAPAFAPCGAAPNASSSSRQPCGIPFPGGDRAAFFNATWRLFRRVGAVLGAANKTVLLASSNWVANISWPTIDSRSAAYRPLKPAAPAAGDGGSGSGDGAMGGLRDPGVCPLPQEVALDIMEELPRVRWARFFGSWHDADARRPPLTGAPSALAFNRSRCIWLTEQVLAEQARGVGTVAHTAVVLSAQMAFGNGDSSVPLPPTSLDLSAASFLMAFDGGGVTSALGFSVGPAAASGGTGAGQAQWADVENTHDAAAAAALSPLGRSLGAPLGPARRLGCCDGALLPHTYVHDAVGASDLFNVVLPNASACAALCCGMDACAGFQWTALQGAIGPISNTSKCVEGGPCCWIKPTIGRIEHITYNATPGSMQFPMVSGVKVGTTWRRDFERVSVTLDCAMPAATLAWR